MRRIIRESGIPAKLSKVYSEFYYSSKRSPLETFSDSGVRKAVYVVSERSELEAIVRLSLPDGTAVEILELIPSDIGPFEDINQ